MRVNVEAVIDLTTRAVQQMVPRGRGAILNVGSTAGYHPFPGQAGYAATKAFVKAYTDGLRGELAGTGVTVAMLAPGPVRTEFLRAAGMDEDKFAEAFPKFLWMSSRDVARIGVEALENDRGTVIAGLRNVMSSRFMQALPRPILLKTLARQHPACAATAAQSAERGQRRIQPSTGSASPLHSVQIVRYQPTAISSSIRCSSSRSSPSARHVASAHDPVLSNSSTAPISTRSAVDQSACALVTSASHSSSLTPAMGPQNAACPPHSYSQRSSAQMRRIAIVRTRAGNRASM